MNTGEFLKKRIIEMFGSVNNFAKEAKIPQSTLATALNKEDGFNKLKVGTALKICSMLGVDVESLDSEEFDEENFERDRLIEIYDSVSRAGKDLIISNAESVKIYEDNKMITFIPMFKEGSIPMVEIPYYDQAAGMGTGQFVEDAMPKKLSVAQMCVPANTDYIIDVTGDSMEPDFHSGDRLFIQITRTLEIGDIGVFSFEGEQLVKEFGNGVLISKNKKYQPIKVNKDLHIQGKVLGKVWEIKNPPEGGDVTYNYKNIISWNEDRHAVTGSKKAGVAFIRYKQKEMAGSFIENAHGHLDIRVNLSDTMKPKKKP